MRTKYVILTKVKGLLLMCLIAIGSFTAQGGQKGNFKNVVITGRVNILTGLNDVKLILSTSVFGANVSTAHFQKQYVDIDANGQFRAVIESPAPRFYLYISSTKGIATFMDNIYMLEAGDEIDAELSPDRFLFTGKGADKLNCQDLIYRARVLNSDELSKLMEIKDLKLLTSRLQINADSMLKKRIGIVNSFRTKLGEEISGIMLANCYGLRHFTDLRTARMNLIPNRTIAYLDSDWYKNLDSFFQSQINERLLIQSPNYVDAIFAKLLLEEAISRTVSEPWMPYGFKKVYDKIKLGFGGLIRQKLLTTLFLQFKTDEGVQDALDEALSLVDYPAYHEILNRIRSNSTKGATFSESELLTVEGKAVTFKQFKDKVVLIDFWFTGCFACKKLNVALKPIVEKFVGNKQVVFVSVNVDNERAKWLESIRGGTYTHPTSVNLFAGEATKNGKRHPILEQYKLTGFPQLILLYDNKIFSLNPPRPIEGDDIGSSGSESNKLLAMINQALGEL